MFNIQENLKKLPHKPGVYMHKDELGQVIYVGKAISLKNRVRQYFQSSKNMDAKVKAMVSHIAEFEYIICGSEMEALILENNLIKEYMPKYNILLRDDKTYPYIKITNEEWPRVLKVRNIQKDGAKYFGPYSDVGAVNQIVEILNSLYKIKTCSARNFPANAKPCLNYHINQCQGICINKADRDIYQANIREMMDFLKGDQKNTIDKLTTKMHEYADNMNFERAAVYRDYIISAKALNEMQRVVMSNQKNMEAVVYVGSGHIVVFVIKEGKLSGRESYMLDINEEDSREEIVAAFIKQYYGKETAGPSEILVGNDITDKTTIEEFLSLQWHKSVKISFPKRGEKKAFVDMAKEDAQRMLVYIEDKERAKVSREKNISKMLISVIDDARIMTDTSEWIDEQTGEIISLKQPLALSHNKVADRTLRIESYDISNIQGSYNVGAMVVFENSKPNKKAYRKFKIKNVVGQDDYASMREVISRRVHRALTGDKAWLPLPDLILIDGGKGHIEVVLDVLNKMNVSIPLVGMAKDDYHRTRALVYHPLSQKGKTSDNTFVEEDIRTNRMLFQYIGTVQEEVHRFAIEYHKILRDKDMTKSVLDDIKGIGSVKKRNLLVHFKSVENIKKASESELLEVEKITIADARNILVYFGKQGD